jgi:hypothetical protein
MTNTDKPDKPTNPFDPKHCEGCSFCHAKFERDVKALDDDKPPANQGDDELNEILKNLQLASFDAGRLGSDRKFGANRRKAIKEITAIVDRQLAERLQMVLDKLPTEWTPREGIATNWSLGALGYNYALREVRNIIKELMPKEAS